MSGGEPGRTQNTMIGLDCMWYVGDVVAWHMASNTGIFGVSCLALRKGNRATLILVTFQAALAIMFQAVLGTRDLLGIMT